LVRALDEPQVGQDPNAVLEELSWQVPTLLTDTAALLEEQANEGDVEEQSWKGWSGPVGW
jgi:hypothetical protein